METLQQQPVTTHQGPAKAEADLLRRFRVQMKTLSELSPAKSLRALMFDWGCIALCLAAAQLISHPAVWVLAALIIAGRQHALLILMHDGAHYRIHPHREINDRISDWLLAYPFLVSTLGYRSTHILHHSYLNSDEDPDWMRKLADANWDLPKTKLMIFGMLLRDLLGGGIWDNLRAIYAFRKNGAAKAKTYTLRKDRLVYYATLAAIITLFDAWMPVLVLWFLPAFTLLPVILRIRSIAEHFGLPGETAFNSSRNYAGPWWERAFFTPHNVGYHLDHHLFPSVPFYNLPLLNVLLNRYPVYREQAYRNDSLASSLERSVLGDISTSSDMLANWKKSNTAMNQERRRRRAEIEATSDPLVAAQSTNV